VPDAEDAPLSVDAIRAKIAAAASRKNRAARDPAQHHRKAEVKQRRERINSSMLRNQDRGHDETWTIRANPDQIKAVKRLAAELSQPGAKVSIAQLMSEGISLLLAHYEKGETDGGAGT
jgi:hypothetical protein